MSRQVISSLTERLQDILATEKTYLQSGRARETVSLAQEKTDVMQDMEAAIAESGTGGLTPTERREIEIVVRMAQENKRHFDAVRHGLRSITARIEGIDNSSTVGAYDQRGANVAFRGATGGYLRKV